MIFLTLFLDLVGFSIIFPLFPGLLEYYFTKAPDGSLLREVIGTFTQWTGASDHSDWRVQTLFGGALGSLYSLLQFLMSPFWGSLSDRVGRRPVLLLTVSGMCVSYALWFVSASFSLLVVARLLGGAMSGNIATATAAVSDITTRADRAKGMGMVGAAFGLGFILGPAIGGGLAHWRLDESFPGLVGYGVNEFSGAAFGSLLLSLLNLYVVARMFPETLSAEMRGRARSTRMINPVKLLTAEAGREIHLLNIGYFIFIVAFSAMEFTLTFLARERFQWGYGPITIIFVYVGLIVAFVQGGLVRRLAPRYGEKRLAMAGMVLVVPGLLLQGYAFVVVAFYAGLTLMAVGSAFIMPSLTSMVSLYAREEEQGRVIGIFRSLGALGRAVGPLFGALLFWKFGSKFPYLAGAALILVAMSLLRPLPQPDKSPTQSPF